MTAVARRLVTSADRRDGAAALSAIPANSPSGPTRETCTLLLGPFDQTLTPVEIRPRAFMRAVGGLVVYMRKAPLGWDDRACLESVST
jgi:hypothetical protein